MARSLFEPRSHAFHFRNGSFHFHVGPATTNVLCGGMSYGVLDYYYTGLELPDTKIAPAEYNPLQSYLYDRQMTAHKLTIPMFVTSWFSPPGAPDIITATSLHHLEAMTGKNQPVVICLFDRPFHGHHVLAIGCNKSAKTIDLYDSNHPDQTSRLAYVDGSWKHTPSNGTWRGWFIDPGYYIGDWPKRPPLSWRYCSRCHGLFTTSFSLMAKCAGGAAHTFNDKFEYFLPCFEGEGDQGWFACEKCFGLYKPSDPTMPPFCSDIGMCSPKKLANKPLTFGVMRSGRGETGWRRCKNCSSLYWDGQGSSGKCPTGAGHEPEAGPGYVVDYRTMNDK
jgi:hypothetical protein